MTLWKLDNGRGDVLLGKLLRTYGKSCKPVHITGMTLQDNNSGLTSP